MFLKQKIHWLFVRELANQFEKDLFCNVSVLWVSFEHVDLHDFADGKCGVSIEALLAGQEPKE